MAAGILPENVPDPIRAAARHIAAVSSPDCRCTFKRGVLVTMCALCEDGAQTIETAMREQVATAVGDLLAALKVAVDALRAFEGLGLPVPAADYSWDLYQHSPEMRQINAAITKAEARTTK